MDVIGDFSDVVFDHQGKIPGLGSWNENYRGLGVGIRDALLKCMKNKIYSFGRFYDPEKVQTALTALLKAGIPRSQIHVLHPAHENTRSNNNAPEQKRFAWRGIYGGLLVGLLVGVVVFLIPAFVFNYRFETGMAIVGVTLTTLVGVFASQGVALASSRRRSGDHVIGPNEHGVFVTVRDPKQEDQLNRAKDAFEEMELAHV